MELSDLSGSHKHSDGAASLAALGVPEAAAQGSSSASQTSAARGVRRPSAVHAASSRSAIASSLNSSAQLARGADGAQTPEVFSRAASLSLAGDEEEEVAAIVGRDGAAEAPPAPVIRPHNRMQPRPASLKSLPQELLFVLICGMGQALFGWLLGNVVVNQRSFTVDLGTSNSQKPWLLGSFLLTNGLSVVISGSLADHLGPKMLMVGGFAWLSLWNLVTGFSLNNKYLFFISRAMQGFACGALTSSSISLLGQTYSPGRRKSRAFSGMAAMAPLGYWLGAVHGGLLAEHRPWIFFSMAIAIALLFFLSLYVVPSTVDARATAARPSLRHFDYLGALLAMIGLGCVVAGLTQGSPAGWQPYTYILIIAGAATLAAFTLAERQAKRPLVPTQLWSVPNFPAVILVYFLAFGAFSVWQFYMLEFFLSVQKVAPLTAALYLTPNAVVGLLCTFGTASLLHVVPGHYVLCVSALASGAGAVFFLPQTANTSYYALSMPGIALATLCPDLSFAAVAVLLTTSVPRTYQGSAGAFLMTAQSLSAAIFIGIGDAIANATPGQVPHADLEMRSLRSVWWFSLAVALVSAGIGLAFVRIPKTQEREHYD